MATGISTKTIFEWSNGKKKVDNNFSNLKIQIYCSFRFWYKSKYLKSTLNLLDIK